MSYIETIETVLEISAFSRLHYHVRNRGGARNVGAMPTEISGIRIQVRATHGDVRVTSGGKLTLLGGIAGTLTIGSGGHAYIIGLVHGLVIEAGGKATLRGVCMGAVINEGGDLQVKGHVKGTLHGRSTTRVTPQAKIARYDEPVDPHTGRGPLPEAAELARKVIEELTTTRWGEVRARFEATMHDQLSEREMAATWPRITKRVGLYRGHGDTDVARVGDLTKTTTPLHFDNGERSVRIAFRDDRTIAGLYILGPDAPAN